MLYCEYQTALDGSAGWNSPPGKVFDVMYRRMETTGRSNVGWMDFCTFACVLCAYLSYSIAACKAR
jgi:hypothetical protein